MSTETKVWGIISIFFTAVSFYFAVTGDWGRANYLLVIAFWIRTVAWENR